MKWDSAGGLDRMLCGYIHVTLDGAEVGGDSCYAFNTETGQVFCYDQPLRIGSDGEIVRQAPQVGRVGVALLEDAPPLVRLLFEIANAPDPPGGFLVPDYSAGDLAALVARVVALDPAPEEPA